MHPHGRPDAGGDSASLGASSGGEPTAAAAAAARWRRRPDGDRLRQL